MSLRSMNTLHVLHPEEQAEHYLKPPCPICYVRIPSQITIFLALRN